MPDTLTPTPDTAHVRDPDHALDSIVRFGSPDEAMACKAECHAMLAEQRRRLLMDLRASGEDPDQAELVERTLVGHETMVGVCRRLAEGVPQYHMPAAFYL